MMFLAIGFALSIVANAALVAVLAWRAQGGGPPPLNPHAAEEEDEGVRVGLEIRRFRRELERLEPEDFE